MLCSSSNFHINTPPSKNSNIQTKGTNIKNKAILATVKMKNSINNQITQALHPPFAIKSVSFCIFKNSTKLAQRVYLAKSAHPIITKIFAIGTKPRAKATRAKRYCLRYSAHQKVIKNAHHDQERLNPSPTPPLL